jgi:hemolysin activation/secretion protein
VRTVHVICVAAAIASASAPLASQVPPGATPGGALPRVEPAVQPQARGGDLFSIPAVSDRASSADAGPRVVVKAFKLQGAVNRPEKDVSLVEAQAILNTARDQQSSRGFSVGELQAVADKLTTYYHQRGFILAQAFVPAQQVPNGEVMVQVLEGRLANVVVEGSKGYTAPTLTRPFKSLIGAPLEKDTIESALLTLTSYPGITAFGVLGAGRDVGTTNLTLRVQSEDRFLAETAVDNYGTKFAGEYRGVVTFTFNDPLHRADRLTLTGLYAMNSSGGGSHGAYGGLDYQIPLFSPSDSLRFIHLTNAYNVGSAALPDDAKGDTRVDEIAYRHDFARTRLGSASVGVALNTKSAKFEGASMTLYDDDLTTARLDAQWERSDSQYRGVNRVSFAYTHGFNDTFGSLDSYDPVAVASGTSRVSRLGASGEFDKIALQFQRFQRLTTYTSLILRAEGQYTSDPLVSLEQFSLGGPDSVRAYATAELLAEKGGVASLEYVIGAPGFASKPAFQRYTWGQVLQFSLFVDYARGQLNRPLVATEDDRFDLSGVGLSAQFTLPSKVFARFDLATPLTDRDPVNGRDPQYFFRFGTTF